LLLIYNVNYNPDLNLIEDVFSAFKTHFRKERLSKGAYFDELKIVELEQW